MTNALLTTDLDQPSGIITVRVGSADSPIVVLDEPLIRRIEATLSHVKSLPGIQGLILASTSDRVFIAGADLKSISALTDDQLDRYLAYGQRVFGMLCSLPFPTAAAINGAALGGGLELAMHCDALIGAPSASGKPYPVGLPEAGLSICPGWGGTNLLPARMDPADAIQRTAVGKPLTYDEAVKAGLFDAVAPSPADLISTARKWVTDARQRGSVAWGGRRDGMPSRWLGRPEKLSKTLAALAQIEPDLPKTGSALAVAAAVRAGIESGWQAALDLERRELTRLRGTSEGKAAIQAFFERSAAPKK